MQYKQRPHPSAGGIASFAHLPIIAIVMVLLGAMLLNDFFTQLAKGHFSPSGFHQWINGLAASNAVPGWWKAWMVWIAQKSAIFAPLLGILIALISICLILLLARGISTFLAALLFFICWISLWAVPGIWIFEFLFPFTFALSASLASLGQFVDGPTTRHRLLGSPLFHHMNIPLRLLIVLISSILLWYVVILSKNAPPYVAWLSAVTFAILFGITAFIDGYRPPNEAKRTVFSKKLAAIPWIDVMVLSVASMMVIQVFADQAIGFYTTKTYTELVSSYAETTSSPEWFKEFLSWSAAHANVLMPLQALFEAFVAVFLSLLILRGPVLLLTTAMFALFTYAEFGVSAEYPGGPGTPRTETWELLFVTLACLFISFKQIGDMFHAHTWREKILGKPLFGKLSISSRYMIALLAGAALCFAGIRTHVFGQGFLATSWLGGVSFAILLVINGYIDRARIKDRNVQH